MLLCTTCLLDVVDRYYEKNPNAAKIFSDDCIFSNKNLLTALSSDNSVSPLYRKFACRKIYLLTADTTFKTGYTEVLKPGPGIEKVRRLETFIPSCNAFENVSFDNIEELYAFLDNKVIRICDYNRRLSTPSPVMFRDRYDQLVDETPAIIRKARIDIERSLNETSSQSQRETHSAIEKPDDSLEPVTKLRRTSNSSSFSDGDYQLRMGEA